MAGIGNIFLGDDGFGVEVAKRLSTREFPGEVRVVDFGIRGFDLAYALLDGYETTILVDAYPHGQAPGTVSLAAAMNGSLKKVLLVGCEPMTFGGEQGHMGLSEPVEAAVNEAVQLVASVVEKILAK